MFIPHHPASLLLVPIELLQYFVLWQSCPLYTQEYFSLPCVWTFNKSTQENALSFSCDKNNKSSLECWVVTTSSEQGKRRNLGGEQKGQECRQSWEALKTLKLSHSFFHVSSWVMTRWQKQKFKSHNPCSQALLTALRNWSLPKLLQNSPPSSYSCLKLGCLLI